MTHAVILLAHGSRDPGWVEVLEAMRVAVQQTQPEIEVQLAYLEHASPSLEQVVQRCVDARCTRLRVVPLFLGLGHHVTVDLPRRLSALRVAHATLVIEEVPALGAWPELHALVARRAATDGC